MTLWQNPLSPMCQLVTLSRPPFPHVLFVWPLKSLSQTHNLKLTDDDLPIFLVVCDFVSGPGLWECESSHDEDDQPRHILPVRLSPLILVPVAVAVAETETINFYQTFSLNLIQEENNHFSMLFVIRMSTMVSQTKYKNRLYWEGICFILRHFFIQVL